MATGGASLLELTMQIAGSTVLTSFPPFGTPVTNSSVSLDGFLTIIEDLSGPIAPVVVPFVAIFTSSDTFALPGDFGESAWTGSFSVDIAAVVPDASKLLFQADTSLVSNAGDGESSAIIQLTGGSIDVRTTVVPLPAAAWLFGSALLGLGAIKRRKS